MKRRAKKAGHVNRSGTHDLKLDKQLLEAVFGRIWTQEEFQAEFKLKGTITPFVLVQRKKDGVKGTLEFQESPRLYYRWQEDT